MNSATATSASPLRRLSVLAGFLVALTCVFGTASATAATTWDFTNLNTTNGVYLATAINNKGDVVGSAFSGSPARQRGFIRRNGVVTLLDYIDPPFVGGSYVLRTPFSSAADVNEAGKVVGISSNGLQSRHPSGGQHAVVWDPFGPGASTPLDLGAYSYNAPGKEPCNTSGSNDLDCYTQGTAINESNDVAGHGEYKVQQSVEEGSQSGWPLFPFLIPAGDRPLTTAEGDGGAADMLFWNVGGGHKLNSFRASGVNDNGQVVVWPDPQTPTNQNSSAIYTENGGPGTAVSIPFNAGTNVYHAINNSGWVIGSDASSPPQRGRLWKAGSTVELPPLPGDTESFASAINNKGDVVGTSRNSSDNCWRAVLWPHADHSAPVDLTEQTTSGWQLYEAHAINDRGQIVGAGFENQTCPGALTFKPYLVTPPALLSVSDTTVKQPLSGTATAHFTVSLGAPLDDPVSVDYETVEGSGVTGAKSPTNYTHTEGELTFAPGETSQNVDVTVKAAGPGPDKTFHLDISNPVGTSIEDERGTATIQSESPLQVTVTADPGKVDIKQTRAGPVPVDVAVDVAVKNLGDVPVDTVKLPEKLTLGWDGPAPVQGFPVTQTDLSPEARELGTIAPGATKHGKYVLRVTADGKLTLDALVLGDAGGQTVPGFGTGKLSSDTQVLALSADMGAQVRSLTQPGMITAGTPFLVNVKLENRSFYRRILIDPIYAELEGNASDGHLQERDVLPTASSPTGSLDEVLPSQYLVLPPGDKREYVAVVRTSASDSFEDEGGGGGTRATVSFEPPIVSSLSDTNEVTELPSDRVAVTAGSTPFAVSIDDAAPPVAPFNYVDAALYVGKGSIWGLWRFSWGTFRGVVWDLPSLAVRSALNVPSATFNAIDRTVQLWRALEKDPVAKAQYINAVADRTATVFEEAPWLIAGAPNAIFNAVSNSVGTRMTNLSKEWEAGDWRGALTEFSAGSTQGVGEVALLLGPGVLARFPAAAARWQATKAALYLKASQRLATVLKKAESAKVALSALRGIVKPGMAFTQKHMTRLFGVGAKESTRIAIYAKAKKLSIVLRSRAAQSIKFIESGKAVLKPYWIKTKNVSHVDAEFLGYYADDIGKVVIRRPLKRAAVEKALAKKGVKKGSPRYVEVIERHDTRIEEYATEFREMAKWDEAKSVKGKWPWEDNGVDPHLQADETSRYGFRLVHDKARNQYVPEIKIKNGWKFITGDIDLIAITKADGRNLSAAEHVAVLKDLRRLMGAQHPESATWIKGGKFWFAAKRNYLRNDGECCLAQYGPDGKIRAVEFNEKLSDPENWKPKNYRIMWRGSYQTGRANNLRRMSEPTPGVFPSQELNRAIEAGWVSSGDYRIRPEAVQPASIDLRLGDFAWALRCSFLPDVDSTVEEKTEGLAFQKVDLRDGAVLERDRPYLVPLIEELALPDDVRAKANPKSSTGRLDVFTRVITDRHHRFDDIRAGYRGRLYLEIVPRSFAIQVKTGLSLNQLRVARGDVRLGDAAILDLQDSSPLLYMDSEPVPRSDLAVSDGLFLSLDLSGPADRTVGYRAKKNSLPVDLSRIRAYRWNDYWDPVFPEAGGRVVLEPEIFYLLLSAEGVCIPPQIAAEMMAYDPTAGELRTHYAGFFDPGFGYDPAGGRQGSRAALEVRARDVSFMVEHRQPVCKLGLERMAAPAERLYGADLGSNYQGQVTMLSKHFEEQTAGS